MLLPYYITDCGLMVFMHQYGFPHTSLLQSTSKEKNMQQQSPAHETAGSNTGIIQKELA